MRALTASDNDFKNKTIGINKTWEHSPNAELHFPLILNIPMKYESSFIQLMRLKDSTGSCVRSPKAGLYFQAMTAS